MSHSLDRPAIVASAVSLLMPAIAAAATPTASDAPHLRPLSSEVRALADELLRRSPTARELAARLERSDVIVYIRYRSFDTATLEGRIGFLASAPQGHGRLLVLELAAGRTRIQQMTTLAHELRHAVEIADAPTVVDPRTMSEHYAVISTAATSEPGRQTFETRAACDTAAQVRLELFNRAVRTEQHEIR